MQYGFPSFGIPLFGLPTFAVPETATASSGSQNETIIAFEYYIVGLQSEISPELYKFISDKYGLIYQSINFCENSFNSAATYIASMDNPDAKIDLLKSIRNSSRELDQIRMRANLHSSVKSLNGHVTNRSGLDNINDWLSLHDVKVIRDWANLCKETGTTIEETNIG